MNYRHAFHAGNFADLVKHGTLTVLLEAMTHGPPLTVVDTHAGAGAYDLAGDMARKSGEAAVERLLADPAAPEVFDILIAAVARANPRGGAQVYPGSPVLIAAALRPQDRLVACELRPDDHGTLAEILSPLSPQAQALRADGFAKAAKVVSNGPTLVLIDPPFERDDDYRRITETTGAVLDRNSAAVIAIWVPLKDLDTFDRFLTRLEALPAQVLIGETRLRPLSDPMRLNGCAMAVINPPESLEEALPSICRWCAEQLGEAGNEARVWRL